MYGTYEVANSIIKKSFEDNTLITASKLYCLMYLLSLEYLNLYKEKLIREEFIYNNKGIFLYSLSYKINCLDFIYKFIRNAKNEVFYVIDNQFNQLLNSIWEKYKHFNHDELYSIIKARKDNIMILRKTI